MYTWLYTCLCTCPYTGLYTRVYACLYTCPYTSMSEYSNTRISRAMALLRTQVIDKNRQKPKCRNTGPHDMSIWHVCNTISWCYGRKCPRARLSVLRSCVRACVRACAPAARLTQVLSSHRPVLGLRNRTAVYKHMQRHVRRHVYGHIHRAAMTQCHADRS